MEGAGVLFGRRPHKKKMSDSAKIFGRIVQIPTLSCYKNRKFCNIYPLKKFVE